MIHDFKSPKEIKRMDSNSITRIKTGFELIDKSIVGLGLGQVSIVSGSNGSGKSSILNQLALNVIQQGYGVGMFSGELTDWRLMEWLYLTAAGKDKVQQVKNKQGELLNFYTVKDYTKDKIDSWLDNKLYVYNNESGMSSQQIGKAMQDLFLSNKNVKVGIFDNLMSMNIQKGNADKYNAQTETILSLCELAKKLNVHIIFVCHPTKVRDFIRKEDISGTADLSNAADNVFIFHRNTSDFKKRSKEFFGWDDNHPIYSYDNIIEIAKNRDFGNIEKLCGFYFDPTCKRILSKKEENFHYGWEAQERQEEIALVPVENFDSPFDD